MDATTLFIVGLFLLVSCAVLVGEAMSRLGQPGLVGQLAVGLVFGPTVLGPWLHLDGLASAFQGLQFLATFFILMAAGLAITPEEIRSTGARAATFGLAIFLLPFLAGTVVVRALYPGLPLLTAVFASLTISVTAVPVLGVVLREFGLAGSRLGTFVLNGALVNELAAVTTFAVLLRLRTGGGAPALEAGIALASTALFLSSVLAAHMVLRTLHDSRVWARWTARFRRTWRSREAGFAVLMVAGLASALFSQYLGLTFLVGAFYAGLLITPGNVGRRTHRSITAVFDTVTWGFFMPLFFALVGLGMNLRLVLGSTSVLVAFGLLAVAALLGKVLVGGAFARLLGWPRRAAAGVGLLSASRGTVELAMAVILLSMGVFSPSLFTVVAGVALVATLLGPVLARPLVRRPAPAGPAEAAPAGGERLGAWIPPPAIAGAEEPAPS